MVFLTTEWEEERAPAQSGHYKPAMPDCHNCGCRSHSIGRKIRINYAIDGITELGYVDSLLVINNEN
jgi:hypothetical protein